MAAAHLVRVCGRNHGLLERITIITDIQTDDILRVVCLLSKDVTAKQKKSIMLSKITVKSLKSFAIEREALCL